MGPFSLRKILCQSPGKLRNFIDKMLKASKNKTKRLFLSGEKKKMFTTTYKFPTKQKVVYLSELLLFDITKCVFVFDV